MTLAETIRQRIVSEFEACDHNVSHTAKVLGVSRRAFYRLAYRHGLMLPSDEGRILPGTADEKMAARTIVKRALERGLRVLPCEVCHTTTDVESHHDDYSKPLSIRWLCKEHHIQIHNRKRAPAPTTKTAFHAFE